MPLRVKVRGSIYRTADETDVTEMYEVMESNDGDDLGKVVVLKENWDSEDDCEDPSNDMMDFLHTDKCYYRDSEGWKGLKLRQIQVGDELVITEN